MSRKTDILALFNADPETKCIVEPMLDDVIFIEGQLSELKKLPFIRVNPKNQADQKATPAAKQYKELLQQYNNCIKILAGLLHKSGTGENDSPLRTFLKELER